MNNYLFARFSPLHLLLAGASHDGGGGVFIFLIPLAFIVIMVSYSMRLARRKKLRKRIPIRSRKTFTAPVRDDDNRDFPDELPSAVAIRKLERYTVEGEIILDDESTNS